MIREVNSDDLSKIAKLHTESFENHFLPKLGLKLLAKYYEEFIDVKNIFIVSVDEKSSEINGLILGTPNSAVGRNRFIKNNKIRLSLRILLLCFRLDKDTWVRIFGSVKLFFTKRDNKSASNSDKPNFKVLSLLSICVSHQSKGNGISKSLAENFEERLIILDYEGYVLTVHKTNERANTFYNNLGMCIYKESDTEYGYVKQLIINN